jgi:hypothetical protein
VAEWIESKRNETELRAFWKYRQIVEEFLVHIGAKANRLLREITPADIRSYRDALKLRPNEYEVQLGLALALRGPIEDAFDSVALFWIFVGATLAYAASYFARGYLANQSLAVSEIAHRPQNRSAPACRRDTPVPGRGAL